MKISIRVAILAAVVLATIGAVAFAIQAPGPKALLAAAGEQAPREGEGAGEHAVALPAPADPELLSARFAVQPGAAPAAPTTPVAPLQPEDQAGPGEMSASWMRYVGRVGGSEGDTIFYYKDERTGSVVRVGESSTAEWQIVRRTGQSFIIRNARDEVLSVEAPE